jgi:outer membrane protein assembly factor BamB
VNNAPAIWHNLVFLTMTSGDLFAIDRMTNQITWHVSPQIPDNGLGAAVITGADVFDDVVYANGADLKLHAYRAQDGGEIWSSAASQLVNDLLVTSKFVYGSDGATLYMFDRQTGARYAALGHPRHSAAYTFSSAAATDGTAVFIVISDGAWSFIEP